MRFGASLEVGKLMGGEVIKQCTDGSFDKFGYKEEEEGRGGLVAERGRRPREGGFSFFKMAKTSHLNAYCKDLKKGEAKGMKERGLSLA